MSSNFKKQAAQKRTAIPQIDPEAAKTTTAILDNPVHQPKLEVAKVVDEQAMTVSQPEKLDAQVRLTQVDTSETPTNRGFSMFPSRHRQVAKDLAYIEDRNPWQIIDDAIEEYVIKHYGKEHKRK